MNGPAPLSWSEIKAWRDLFEVKISSHEIDSIRRMSSEYVSFYFEANKKDCPPPHTITIEELDRTAVSNRVKSALSIFKKKADVPQYTVEDNKG